MHDHERTAEGSAAGASCAEARGAAPERRGVQLGSFLLGDKCGEGAMGVVYAARDLRDGRTVAVKVLPAALLADLGRARRFAAEAKVLASLDHPAIVRHAAHGITPQGEPFLAMEWLDGEDLARTLARRGLALHEVAVLGERIASGLAVAHAQGIIHRDIKPSNLFLRDGKAEDAVILDFGIARVEDAPLSLTATGTAIGTPGYMAPEQASGSRSIDARADLFSLGAVLFECLAGRPAFAAQHVMAVLAKVLLEDPPELVTLRPDIPHAMSALVARLLAKDPEARPASAEVVAAELARISVGGNRVEAEPRLAHVSRPPSLTESEQRFLCVVVAGARHVPTWGAQDSAATLPAVSQDRALAALSSVTSTLGADVVCLRDGSVLAVAKRTGSAADQAVHAGRYALACRRLLPDVPLVVVTGLGDISTPVPVGHVLDRAAALVQAHDASAGPWIDEVTAGLLDARFVVREGPSGRELLEERWTSTGARRLLGRTSPCVGRERELRTLGDMLDECITERVTRAVLVKAPAGAGKSRLLHELLAAASRRDDGLAVWLGRSDMASAGSAFALLSSALRYTTGTRESEPLEVRRQKLADRVGQHVPPKDRARVAAFLGELVATPFPDSELPMLRSARRDPAILGEHLRRAVEDFLSAECSAHPVLLALEDVHWGDMPSLKIIDGALGKLRDRPLLVVALGRPEVDDLFPKLWAERGVQELRLPDLTQRAAGQLVRHALGEAVSADMSRRIVERAAGNAFYLEELIRAVAEGRGEDLPETVLAMVQARLDALGPEDRRLLRAASIFGETFWKGGVAALLGSAERTAPLEALVHREVFVRREESRLPGEDEFAFRHALLREGAYATLTEQDRAVGHRLAGAWLEERGERDPLVLAEHMDRGGEPERAVIQYLRAAERALAGGDPAAVQRAERGLACGAQDEPRHALMGVLSRARWTVGDRAGAWALCRELLDVTPPGSRIHCAMLSGKLFLALQRGDRRALLEAIEATRDVVPSAENSGPLAELCWAQLSIAPEMGGHAIEQRAGELARVASPLDGMARAYVTAMSATAAVYFDRDLGRAAELYVEAAEHLEAAGHIVNSAHMRASAGEIYGMLGAHDRCEEELRRALTEAGSAGVQGWMIRSSHARMLVARGAAPEALAEAERLVREIVAQADPGLEGRGRQLLACALYGSGDLASAAREAEASLRLPSMYISLQRAETLATLAAVRLAEGRTAEALAAAREAMGSAEPPPVRAIQEPFIRLVHIDALTAAGEHDAARAALVLARGRLLSTAARIGDPALQRSFLEGVPDNARTLRLAEERLGPMT
ncbi:protein kinase domain-containing protein [Sorangium sp. So ce1000]|uniref:protein kinase domain-containing protein n=1 Tax=Sorangium sp. So ce1000 TaxID=3133325 RepID=UPI003F5E4246